MTQTAFTALTGCVAPVQQAPMGGVSTPDLAVAVAEAGGLGTTTALGLSAEQLALRLDDMCRRTTGVLAVNFLTEVVDADAVAAAAERVRLVDFFWLDPRPSLVEAVHAAGALACWQVGSLDEARAAVDAGCDVVAVQGVEAGGHVRGRSALLPLLAAVLDVVDVPVLAAGGISHGRQLAAVLAAGAAGARCGTSFAAAAESGAHPAYKQALVQAGAGSTVVSDAFAACPLCATSPRARVLTSAVEALHRTTGDAVGQTAVAGQVRPVVRGSGLPPLAGTTGTFEAMALYAGEGVGHVTGVRPAAQVLAELCAFPDAVVPAQASRTAVPAT